MIVLTSEEAESWMKDSNDSGWILDGNGLSRCDEQATCVQMEIPDAKHLLRVFTRDVTTVLGEQYNVTGLLVQLTEWTLGTSDFDQVGWRTCELMRRGYGELRSLEQACAHLFRFDEVVEARALLMQVFVNQWSAVLAPNPLTFFISIDEEQLSFQVHDSRVAQHVLDELHRWNPRTI